MIASNFNNTIKLFTLFSHLPFATYRPLRSLYTRSAYAKILSLAKSITCIRYSAQVLVFLYCMRQNVVAKAQSSHNFLVLVMRYDITIAHFETALYIVVGRERAAVSACERPRAIRGEWSRALVTVDIEGDLQ